jgi:hypothetical protein
MWLTWEWVVGAAVHGHVRQAGGSPWVGRRRWLVGQQRRAGRYPTDARARAHAHTHAHKHTLFVTVRVYGCLTHKGFAVHVQLGWIGL